MIKINSKTIPHRYRNRFLRDTGGNVSVSSSGNSTPTSGTGTENNFEPHYLWGQYFDDTEDIKGDMTGVGDITSDGDFYTTGKVESSEVESDNVHGNTLDFNTGNIDQLTSTTITADSGTISSIRTNNIRSGEGYIGNLSSDYASIKEAVIDALSSTNITTDYLTVTKQAHFFSLIIDELKSIGGQVILSPANMKVSKVWLKEDGSYRLYAKSKDEDRQINNKFLVNDQVICQTFNVATGTSYSASNKYYWGLVTGTGTKRNAHFDSPSIKATCVTNFDTEGDGDITYEEIQAVTSIGTIFNNNCTGKFNELQYFTGISTIPTEAFNSSDIEAVTLPSTITRIYRSGFRWCNKLEEITLNDGLIRIGYCAFRGCNSLSEVTIPSTVTMIEGLAFSMCNSLKKVNFEATDPSNYSNNAFNESTSLETITVPSGYLSVYQEAFPSLSSIMSEATVSNAILTTNSEPVLYDEYFYIDLSGTVYNGTLNPEEGDEIVQLGYRGTDDDNRQNAIIISAYNSIDSEITAPSYAQYKGINDFNLSTHRYTWFASNENRIRGDLRISDGTRVDTLVSNYVDKEYIKGENKWAVPLVGWQSFGGETDTVEYDDDFNRICDTDSDLYSPAVWVDKGRTIYLEVHLVSVPTEDFALCYSTEVYETLSDYYEHGESVWFTPVAKTDSSGNVKYVIEYEAPESAYYVLNYVSSDNLYSPEFHIIRESYRIATTSELTQTADSIKSTVTNLTNYVSGRNMLTGVLSGEGWKSGTGGTPASLSYDVEVENDWLIKNSAATIIFSPVMTVEANQYSVSFDADGTDAINVAIYNADTNTKIVNWSTSSGATRRTAQVVMDGAYNIRLAIIAPRIRYPQFELGSECTDFVVKTEEVASSVVQKADSITSRVSALEKSFVNSFSYPLSGWQGYGGNTSTITYGNNNTCVSDSDSNLYTPIVKIPANRAVSFEVFLDYTPSEDFYVCWASQRISENASDYYDEGTYVGYTPTETNERDEDGHTKYVIQFTTTTTGYYTINYVLDNVLYHPALYINKYVSSSELTQTANSIKLEVTEDIEGNLKTTGIDVESGKIDLIASNTNVIGSLNVYDNDAGLQIWNSDGTKSVQIRNNTMGDITDYAFGGSRDLYSNASGGKSVTASGSYFDINFSELSIGQYDANKTIDLGYPAFYITSDSGYLVLHGANTTLQKLYWKIEIKNGDNIVATYENEIQPSTSTSRTSVLYYPEQITYTTTESSTLSVVHTMKYYVTGDACSACSWKASVLTTVVVDLESVMRMSLDGMTLTGSGSRTGDVTGDFVWWGKVEQNGRTNENDYEFMVRNGNHNIKVTPIGVYRTMYGNGVMVGNADIYKAGSSVYTTDGSNTIYNEDLWGDISATSPVYKFIGTSLDLATARVSGQLIGMTCSIFIHRGSSTASVYLPNPAYSVGRTLTFKSLGGGMTVLSNSGNQMIKSDCGSDEVTNGIYIGNKTVQFICDGTYWIELFGSY